MKDEGLKQRLEAVERLTRLYRGERLVYLIVTVMSLAVLLVAAVVMLCRGTAGPAELGAMFGASGMVTYTAGQLLRMWDRALSMVADDKREAG